MASLIIYLGITVWSLGVDVPDTVLLIGCAFLRAA